METTAYLLVNFGGPRDLDEIEEFLICLLTDQEVIRTPFPAFLHRLLFKRIAKKRSREIRPDYALIGGRSPIFEDTQAVASSVSQKLGANVLTFHRYLPKTHGPFIQSMQRLHQVQRICIVPMFPQFSYATTGSIALWFSKHLPQEIVAKMRWVKSYPEQGAYIAAMQQCLSDFMQQQGLGQEETVLLFSAHGLPQSFILTGDNYEKECRLCFERLKVGFPRAHALLSFQSQFGKQPWIRPYTAEVCAQMGELAKGRKNVVVIPLSFTSDHIETLYEIQELYLPVIRSHGLRAYRCPALNRREDWISAIAEMFQADQCVLPNTALIRHSLSHR